MNTKIENYVKSVGVSVPGYTVRDICPVCNGGRSNESSFVVRGSDDGTLSYKCFRDSCKVHGHVKADGVITSLDTETRKKPNLRPYTRELYPLQSQDIFFFAERFYLTKDILEKYVRLTYHKDYAFYLYTIDDSRWGVTVRYKDWKTLKDRRSTVRSPRGDFRANKKSTLYWHHPYVPKIAICRGTMPSDTVVLVEDIVSAMRISQDTCVDGCALLGTHINLHAVQYLKTQYTKCIILLDDDATETAIDIYKRVQTLFDKTTLIVDLGADPKDVSPSTLLAHLSRYGITV